MIGQSPKAAFSVDGAGQGCAPLTVSFQNQSTGVYDAFEWQFPGGNPATSTLENPVVTYSAPGEYDVTLFLNGPLGESTSSQQGYIQVFDTPLPDFTWSADGLTIHFTNQSTNAGSFSWNFGDGQTSFDENPVHVFAQPGIYDITLNAQNSACGVSLTQSILLQTNGVHNLRDNALLIFPNPVRGILFMEDKTTGAPFTGNIRLLTLHGAVLEQKTLNPPGQLDFSRFPTGSYVLEFQSGSTKRAAVVIKN